MPSESFSDQNYTGTTKSTESESDPNYESVNHDNNYESVKYNEPPYERLNDNDSIKTESDVGYETIKKNNEPPYQKIRDLPEDNESNYDKSITTKSNDDDIVIQV